jgi:hypothetical protein
VSSFPFARAASPELASILERIDRFVAAHPGAPTGPAHVVVDDLNLGNHNIDACLARIERRDFGRRLDERELQATWHFLKGLRDIPEGEREDAMYEYWGEQVSE